MSIRIRESGGRTIALCAVEADPMPGDQYLDDAAHYALAAKFAQDWQGQTVGWAYPEEWDEMAKHKMRDAETELNGWLDGLQMRGAELSDSEFLDGYRDGRDPNCPEPSDNRSACYRHSFAVGRAELEDNPIPAELSRERAAEAEAMDRSA